MIVNVYQTITIHTLRVEGLSNSSILQIGSAGLIKGISNNYNTGGFTGPAPEATTPGTSTSLEGISSDSGEGDSEEEPSPVGSHEASAPLVPLPAMN